MPKQLNLILNGKGGVGKSFFAVNFVQYLKDQQINHVAIDTDNENSTLKRFHPETRFVNLAEAQELDQLVTAVASASLIVVDGRAASTDVFLSYFAELAVFDVLQQMGAALTVISPVNHDLDSVEQLRLIADSFRNRCRYLVVRNQVLTEQFTLYDASKTRKRLRGEFAAQEMIMPKLQNWLVSLLHEHTLSVSAAARSDEVPLMDRQRLKNWQRQFEEQLHTVRSALLPGDA